MEGDRMASGRSSDAADSSILDEVRSLCEEAMS